jgi:hypothetical protein
MRRPCAQGPTSRSAGALHRKPLPMETPAVVSGAPRPQQPHVWAAIYDGVATCESDPADTQRTASTATRQRLLVRDGTDDNEFNQIGDRFSSSRLEFS